MPTTQDEFPVLSDFIAAGMTDYVAIISRFAGERVLGDMDGVYASWTTRAPGGFSDGQIDALQRIAPYLALAIKSVSLARMTGTLMETYLGRDAGQRVLSGRIVRGIAERIDAAVWFSDLRGFTRITDTAPEQAIPLLNDYADVIVSAIHEHGGDVLKLIGDGTLAIFTADNRTNACGAAKSAAIAARAGIVELNRRRAADGKPTTDMYLGLHVGEVFYGNVGSRERLDFTVIGPAVNEASRIAAMCRSVDQPVLMSSAFADVGDMKTPPRFGRPIRAARRRASAGAVYARSRCMSGGTRRLVSDHRTAGYRCAGFPIAAAGSQPSSFLPGRDIFPSFIFRQVYPALRHLSLCFVVLNALNAARTQQVARLNVHLKGRKQ